VPLRSRPMMPFSPPRSLHVPLMPPLPSTQLTTPALSGMPRPGVPAPGVPAPRPRPLSTVLGLARSIAAAEGREGPEGRDGRDGRGRGAGGRCSASHSHSYRHHRGGCDAEAARDRNIGEIGEMQGSDQARAPSPPSDHELARDRRSRSTLYQVTLAESVTLGTDLPPALRPRERTPPALWRESATRSCDAADLDASEEDVTPGCQQQ